METVTYTKPTCRCGSTRIRQGGGTPINTPDLTVRYLRCLDCGFTWKGNFIVDSKNRSALRNPTNHHDPVIV